MSSGHIKPRNRNSLSNRHVKIKSTKTKSKFLRHIYNSKKWKTLRNKYIEAHPKCEICGCDATQVHHIIRFSTGENEHEIEQLAYDYNNLMSLCAHCHISKHKDKN